ncbi:MAG: hypothetical protein HYV45_02385 [Candidatus Moranbacteria bacterium]|nr:hypothetical protein [Candidatus Moranbacteria bacterium]
MRKFSSFLLIVSFLFAGLAQAEVFDVKGGSISAARDGGNVVITVTGIPASSLVHFRGQGVKDGFIHQAKMEAGKGVLEDVAKNGGRFQLRDEAGKWLLITPTNNSYEMVGVTQECKKSKAGCALEVK